MEFPRQEYWSGLPFLPPEDFPNPGIEPGSPALQTDSLPAELLGKPFLAIISHQLWAEVKRRKGKCLLRANTKPGAYCSDGLILAGSQVHFKVVSPVRSRTSHLWPDWTWLEQASSFWEEDLEIASCFSPLFPLLTLLSLPLLLLFSCKIVPESLWLHGL